MVYVPPWLLASLLPDGILGGLLNAKLIEKAVESRSVRLVGAHAWYVYIVTAYIAVRVTQERAADRLRVVHEAAYETAADEVTGGDSWHDRWLRAARAVLFMLPVQLAANHAFAYIAIFIAMAACGKVPALPLAGHLVVVQRDAASGLTTLASEWPLAATVAAVLGMALVYGAWVRERGAAARAAGPSRHHDMALDRVVALSRWLCALLGLLHAGTFVFFALVLAGRG